ncbi:nuclear transport factor 2 family protein [Nocardioides sp. Root151]|uniref:nuclear transport factor 2 family protein n=1 Tax=Nocardioides sp. Root151 TaxID=1736475 RepID=UPI0007025809|nr:nuclear transport factor 2 family protein [Nocardioides sp. Root151]KQZ75578.1 hypothetical protein ASD66_04330 [Nocardioides sp. Root151]
MSGPALTPESADLVELRHLVHRYAGAVDDRDPAGVAGLFTDDGVLATARPPTHLDPVEEHVGQAGVRAAMEQVLGLRGTFHAACGEVFTAGTDADTATGRIACEAHHYTDSPDGPRDLVWTVTYRDHYRRTPAGWRFSRREVHVGSVRTQTLKAVR